MGIGDKLKKVRQLGAAGSMKMAAVKWKKMELTEEVRQLRGEGPY